MLAAEYCDWLVTIHSEVINGVRYVHLSVRNLGCYWHDVGGWASKKEEKKDKGKDYDHPDCVKLRDAGVTEAQFNQLKYEWAEMNRNNIGQEVGSLWITNRESPTGYDFVPMIPTFGDNGNPAMNIPSYTISDPEGAVVAMSHMHPSAFPVNGDMNNWTPALYWESSNADKRRAHEISGGIRSYIGAVDALFYYDPVSTTDVNLMRGEWWDKDCF